MQKCDYKSPTFLLLTIFIHTQEGGGNNEAERKERMKCAITNHSIYIHTDT